MTEHSIYRCAGDQTEVSAIPAMMLYQPMGILMSIYSIPVRNEVISKAEVNPENGRAASTSSAEQ